MPSKPRRSRESRGDPSSTFGLLNPPDADEGLDDLDLEAELLALTGGVNEPAEFDHGNRSSDPRRSNAPGRGINFGDIERLARQISQEVDFDADEDPSVETDADLLDELGDILGSPQPYKSAPPPPSMALRPGHNDNGDSSSAVSGSPIMEIENRLKMYQAAEQSAKKAGDTSKVRRYSRGVQTLNSQLRTAKSGKPVPDDDLPPVLAGTGAPHIVPTAEPLPDRVVSAVSMEIDPSPSSRPRLSAAATVPPIPSRQAPLPPRTPDRSTRPELSSGAPHGPAPKLLPPIPSAASPAEQRQVMFKKAALDAKHRGDQATALENLRIAKQIGILIAENKQNGTVIDMSQLPSQPMTAGGPRDQASMVTKSPPTPPKSAAAQDDEMPSWLAEAMSLADDTEPVPESGAASIAVKRRSSGRKSLSGENIPEPKNTLEALEQRLEKFKSAKVSATNEGNSSKARRMQRIINQYNDAVKGYKAGQTLDYNELPTPPGYPPIPPPKQQQPAVRPTQQPAGTVTPGSGPSPPKASRNDQQLQFLVDRHDAFRQAALAAKRIGQKEAALNYLKQMKGLEAMITAAQNGLPVDIRNVPQPPQMKASIGSGGKVASPTTGSSPLGTDPLSNEELYTTLQEDLARQFKLSTDYSSYFTKLGDVVNAKKFDDLCLNLQRDIVTLRHSAKRNGVVPIFHYEMMRLPNLKSNPDLTENVLELGIIRALQVPCPSGYEPKDLYLFVSYSFPFPQDSIQTAFNHVTKLNVNRKSRQLARTVKSKSLKLEVFHKGGMFRSDKLLGTVDIKLAQLEDESTIHNSFDLMDGRKPAGGKLEVKLRLRDPFSEQSGPKQQSETSEKWLIIDKFEMRQ